uniref:Uncharacterized protein n=1 Tax=Anguilla anguilla TaxID=7936 RepID=A0A0E9SJG0_ANGAN
MLRSNQMPQTSLDGASYCSKTMTPGDTLLKQPRTKGPKNGMFLTGQMT